MTTNPISSQSVSFWSVRLFVERWRESVGVGPEDFPMLGTPAWCNLPDDDPRKLAAVHDGGQHHALRIETAQEARAEASRAVAGAADWAAISREIRQRQDFHAANPWAKRVVH